MSTSHLAEEPIDLHGSVRKEVVGVSLNDEKIVLIQDSCPNYAKIDHFANA